MTTISPAMVSPLLGILCGWFLWGQVVEMPQAGQATRLSPERFRYVEVYDTKAACTAAAETGVTAHMVHAGPTTRLEMRCLPQGLHPRDATH